MKERVTSVILSKMYDVLTENQMEQLKDTLNVVLWNIDLKEKETQLVVIDETWKDVLQDFLVHKKLSGKSDKTIKNYGGHLFKLLSHINKPVDKITYNDIYEYLCSYKTIRKISNRSLENMRLVFSSFFTWTWKHKYIADNPMSAIESIKYEQKVKKPLSDEERERLNLACKNKRDRALLEFFYSTGIRVGELVLLNKKDIDFIKNELVVFGKGAKERTVYMNQKTSFYLREYLNSRDDDNEALFVSIRKPYNRMTVSGIENALKTIAKNSEIIKVHPHRFRRTCATNALDKGMDIVYVSELLGHVSTNTTKLYCTINKNNVKVAHAKYLSA